MPELFYDGSQDPEFIAELEAEQADSEQIGSQIQEAESQRLAGKFESAEELERAYLELQQLLGKKSAEKTDDDESSEEDSQEDEEAKEEAKEEDDEFDAVAIVAALNEEYAANGTLSQETIDNLQQLSPLDVAALFLQAGVNPAQESKEPQALTKEEADAFVNMAGGQEQYNAMVAWGRENYAPAEVDAFNQVIESGDQNSIYFAILALKSRYAEAEGAEGRQLTRTRPSSSRGDVFRSQAEVQRAMADPRYDEDPAFRQDVFEKLARSNLDYD